jgi:hypothetical protein
MLSYSPTHGVAQGLSEALDWYVERARDTADHGVVSPYHANGSTPHLPQFDGTPLTMTAS